jgi:hypothetical protein
MFDRRNGWLAGGRDGCEPIPTVTAEVPRNVLSTFWTLHKHSIIERTVPEYI